MAEKGESASGSTSVAHGLAPFSDAGLEARHSLLCKRRCSAALRLTAEVVRPLQTDALHRKRALAVGIVRHWAELVGISLLGSAWCAATCTQVHHAAWHAQLCPPHRLSLVCFWTIRASVNMCDYVVSDKPRYNADVSIMEVCFTHPPWSCWFALMPPICRLLLSCSNVA
jgi:hypothetical protein